jgi:hemerythrin-like domain-containing protein
MASVHDTLTKDHRRCDNLFATVEEAVSSRRWDLALEEFHAFRHAMERHFGMEEGGLFPAFEGHTGTTRGPNEVMRLEHSEMRGLMEQMEQRILRRDAEDYLGLSDWCGSTCAVLEPMRSPT